MNISALAALLMAAQAPQPAVPAADATKIKMTCPIGGSPFDYARPAASQAIGMRPDGKPYGPGQYPAALPECPDNGLILYKDYAPAEVEKLTPLVASAEYQALRGTDTAYYRAYWLMKALGESPDKYLWVLLQASWEAESRPALRDRYLSEFVEASAAIPARPDDVEWIGMEGRAINALRELGRFDEAKARLAALPLASLEKPLGAAESGTEAGIRTARVRRTWINYFKSLGPLIDRKDKAVEPFEMIPGAVAVRLCAEKGDTLDPHQRAYCTAEGAAVEQAPGARPVSPSEAELLRQPRTR